MFSIVKNILVVLVISTIIRESFSWWDSRRRRRRRAPCHSRDCQVGQWSSWSSCTHQCGNAGTQSRSRSRTVSELCGGRCPYSLSESRDCNRNACQNGGTPDNGYCRCRTGFGGTCCQEDVDECVTIRPCQHKCTNTYGSYTCQCNPCYTKVGTRCDLRQCLIGGKCYRYGNVNPSNQCQDCNSGNKLAWTNNNALKCSDGQACTRADHCSNGRCIGTPFTCLSCEVCQSDTCKVKPGYCTIVHQGKKTCFNNKALRPGHPCQQCDSNNPHQWTSNNNLRCSDNNVKTKDDRCVSGTCRGTPYSCLPCESHDGSGCPLKSGHCVIQHSSRRTCFANQNLKPGNPCQWCNPGSSTSTWSNRNGVSCDDSNKCTKSDTCTKGQCTGTAFTCNSHCQTCNGRDCSQKTGFGFVKGKCTCRIFGKDYNHQELNPSNQCQWCNLYDAASKSSGSWTNRPSVPCNDGNACTHKDTCNKGKCAGQPYSCQSSYPSTSCIKTSNCLGNGRCNDIMRPSGTICRAAKDACDKPEKCNGKLGACPADVTDIITIKTGSVQFRNPSFTANAAYQHKTNSLYVSITGFSINCGAMKYKWFLLDGGSPCTTASISKGDLPNTNSKQTISSLSLLDNRSYKLAIQAMDMRQAARPLVCSSPVTIDTTRPKVGWVYDGTTSDIDFQATKTISANWGGFNTRNGIGKYEWKVSSTAFGSGVTSDLLSFTGTGVNTKASKTFSNIVDGSTIEVVVRAFTKAGLYSDSTSDGVTVDLSKPTTAKIYDGSKSGVDAKYAKWTNTFFANWDAFTDPHSGISHYEWAVKRGAGLITAFKSTGSTRSASASGLNLVSGETYCAVVKAYNKARLSAEATSDCVLIDRDPPLAGTVNDGLSSDVQHQSNGSSISANWNGFSDGAKGSGIAGYQYKITDGKNVVIDWTSVGTKTSITHSGLPLKNGVKYFVIVRAIDEVGLSTDVRSNGVIVDTSSPVFNGKVEVRGTKDVYKGSNCVYTKSNTTLAVTWIGFTDGHSGLSHYEWAVIPASQSVKPSDFKKVSGSSLTTSASFSALALTNGQLYKVIIRAYNRAFLYSDASSVVIIPDSTPPQPGLVNDGPTIGVDVDFQGSLSFVNATWTIFNEPHTGIRQYYYAVGSCTKGNYHITNNKFIQASPPLSTSMTIENLNLVNGQRYCTKVKAKNMAGIYSVEVTSDGFMADKTPPDILEARVIDGWGKIDIDYQANLTEMSGSWDGIKDPESSIKFFEVGISRNKAGVPDIFPFKNVGLQTSATAPGLSLAEGVYYFIVCAINYAALKSCLSSDGVFIDKTQPSKGIVNDGVLEPDLKYQSSLTSMAANWEGIWDLQSQIERFEWSIKDNTKDENIVQPFIDVGLATHVQNEQPLALVNGRTYKVYLNVYNHAGAVRQLTSDGVTVDSRAPHPSQVKPGVLRNKDWVYYDKDKTFYTSSSTHIFAHWDDFVENESELWYYKWAIGTSKCGTQVQSLTNIGRSTNVNSTMSDLKFYDGIRYYVTVTAKNRADLISRSCSEAFLMDRTPPNAGDVNVGDPNHHQKYIGRDVEIYWRDFNDKESGIDFCDISIANVSDQVFIDQAPGKDAGSISVRKDYFRPGQEYKVVIKCVNKANLTTIRASKPFIVDVTAPVTQNEVIVGVSRDSIRQYQSDNRSVTITWPSFSDPESPIKEYFLSIGTTSLGDNILALTSVGMATQFVRSDLELLHGSMYYITVIGVNAAGLNSTAQGLPLKIDSSPPLVPVGSIMDGAGKTDWDFFNPNVTVEGHWEKVSDPESGILKTRYCLGTKPAGCQIQDVIEINKTSFTCKSCKIKPGEKVYLTVQITNGAGLSSTQTSDGMIMDTSPPHLSKVIDGDDDSGKDMETVLSHWNISMTWQGAEDRQSGINKCKWTIVDGDDQEVFTFDILGPYKLGPKQSISPNQPYRFASFNSSRIYFNVIECSNGARSTANARSNGFRVVSRWPIPGKVRDGLKDGKDLDYLTSTKVVGAHWDAFKSDSRDPVSNYAWAIGASHGEQDIMEFRDAGLKLRDKVTLAPDEPDLDVLEPGKRYFITVKGTSVSGLSTSTTSNGFKVDTTPPIKSDVQVTFNISDYSSNTVDFNINWSGVKDDESGITESEFCIGTIPRSCTTSWTSSDNSTEGKVSSFKPVSLAGYYATVVVTNNAGLTTTITSKKISIDITPPKHGQIIDGLETDLDFTNTTSSISVNWTEFLDSDTGVKECIWALVEQSASSDGSYFGNDTTVFEETVGPKGNKTRGGLALKPGSRYINKITCANRDGFTATSASDGIIVDLTPPVSNKVIDGSCFDKDIQYTSDLFKVASVWKRFTDTESNIMGYRFALGTSPGKEDVITFNDVGLKRKGEVQNLTLVPGGPYYFTVEATNYAGLSSQGWSDGFIIDVTPPELRLNEIQNQWIGQSDYITASWQSYDLQSEIKFSEYCIGTSTTSCQVKPMTMLPLNSTNFTCTDCQLNHNTIYYASIRTWNKANLFTVKTTDAIQTDFTPPTKGESVPLAVVVSCLNNCELRFNISGFEDPESGIKTCKAGISNSSGLITTLVTFNSPDVVGFSNLTLQHGQRYSAVVTCVNNAGLERRVNSDLDVLVDATPPTKGRVIVSPDRTHDVFGIHSNCHLYNRTLRIHWSGFQDPETGITGFKVSLTKQNYSSSLLQPKDVGVTTSTTLDLDIDQGVYANDILYVTVEARNTAGLVTRSQSPATRMVSADSDRFLNEGDFFCV